MDRWCDDDEAGEAERPRRRGRPRHATEVELSWDHDDGPIAFEGRYDPDELAAIEQGPRSDVPVTSVSQWRRRSALGAVLTGMVLGLQEVFDPEEERSIVIEVDADGEPLDLPVQMFLDPDSPAGSLCIVHASDNRKPPVV